jgi:hypothetical protein
MVSSDFGIVPVAVLKTIVSNIHASSLRKAAQQQCAADELPANEMVPTGYLKPWILLYLHK